MGSETAWRASLLLYRFRTYWRNRLRFRPFLRTSAFAYRKGGQEEFCAIPCFSHRALLEYLCFKSPVNLAILFFLGHSIKVEYNSDAT